MFDNSYQANLNFYISLRMCKICQETIIPHHLPELILNFETKHAWNVHEVNNFVTSERVEMYLLVSYNLHIQCEYSLTISTQSC